MMLNEDDDELARILEGRDSYAATDDRDEVLAETVIRVRLDGHLGELELSIPHRDGLAAAPDEESLHFYMPDASYLEPAAEQKLCLTVRVRDLDRVLGAMQRAVTRARALGVIP